MRVGIIGINSSTHTVFYSLFQEETITGNLLGSLPHFNQAIHPPSFFLDALQDCILTLASIVAEEDSIDQKNSHSTEWGYILLFYLWDPIYRVLTGKPFHCY